MFQKIIFFLQKKFNENGIIQILLAQRDSNWRQMKGAQQQKKNRLFEQKRRKIVFQHKKAHGFFSTGRQRAVLMSRWRPVTRIVRFPIFGYPTSSPTEIGCLFGTGRKQVTCWFKLKLATSSKSTTIEFLNFAAKRFGESSCTQKTFDRAFQGLSIGLCWKINWIKFGVIVI